MVCNRMGDYLVLPFQGADDFSHKTVDLYIETVDLYIETVGRRVHQR